MDFKKLAHVDVRFESKADIPDGRRLLRKTVRDSGPRRGGGTRLLRSGHWRFGIGQHFVYKFLKGIILTDEPALSEKPS